MWQVYFVLPIQFISTLTSDRANLYWNVEFSILVLSTKKRYSSFLKRTFVFQKIYSKVRVWKTITISSDYNIKAYWSLNRRAILKMLFYRFLEEPTLFLFTLKWNLLKMRFPVLRQKTTQILQKPCWNAERSNHSLLSIWWIIFFKYLCSLISDNGMYRN